MSLYPYLKAIENGRFINAPRMAKLLKQHGIELENLGITTFVCPNQYQFTVSNKELFHTLLKKCEPSRSRIHAAKQGDSHRYPTRTSYLFTKYGIGREEVDAICCSPDKVPSKMSNYPSETPVILIENSDCFTYSDDFLLAMELEEIAENALIILSLGNAITHKQAVRFLSHFQTIYYCPDYDFAGIEIYETLNKSLGSSLIFHTPANLVNYKSFCQKPKNRKRFVQAIDKAEKLRLHKVYDLFSSGLGFLEQEIFLGEEYEQSV